MNKAYLSWPALLLCPSIALGNLIITFALVTPACASQQHVWLHTVTLVSLALSLVFTLLAVYARGLNPSPENIASDASTSRPNFLAALSLWSGIFFTMTIAAQWLGQWLLSPCL